MTKREKNMLYFAVIIIAIAVYTMIILPYIGKTNLIIEDTAFLQQEINFQNRKIEAIPKLKQNVAEKQLELYEFKHAYNDAQTQEAIATYFTNLAEENQLDVISFSQTRSNQLLKERELELFPMAEIKISCHGEYSNFISMVDAFNQRNDITILSLDYGLQNSKDPIEEYTIKCLLLMNDNGNI